MTPRPFLAFAALLAFASCTSHTIDRAGWERDLKAAGMSVTDWDKLERTVLDLCDDDEAALRTFVALSADAHNPTMDQLRVDFKHACPDRMEALEQVIGSLETARSEFRVACAVPEEDRSQAQRDLIAAVGTCP